MDVPNTLLLDEVDSTLHPSMVKSLLQVVEDVFVRTYGVKVILATHSPTTVALAPEHALYTMRRMPAPRLRQAANRDDALRSLTVGLPTLSIRIENRRLVFVESEHDETCYQELFRILRPLIGTAMSVEFVASGRGGQGNSEAVSYLVRKLRDGGNSNVWGVVDRDNRSAAGDGIIFNPERYSLENVVLDPVILGIFLLREGIVSGRELAIRDGLRHFELMAKHHQAVVHALTRLMGVTDGEAAAQSVAYCGGFSLTVPRFWLDTKGHELEARIIATFPPLKRFRKKLSASIIGRACGDMPQCVPDSVVKMMVEILGK